MTLTPCKIEDIALRSTNFDRAGENKAALLSFLAMETPAVKVEGVSGTRANTKQNSFKEVIQKEGFPIRALTRKGTLYLVNTAKAPEFAV